MLFLILSDLFNFLLIKSPSVAIFKPGSLWPFCRDACRMRFLAFVDISSLLCWRSDTGLTRRSPQWTQWALGGLCAPHLLFLVHFWPDWVWIIKPWPMLFRTPSPHPLFPVWWASPCGPIVTCQGSASLQPDRDPGQASSGFVWHVSLV